MSEPQFESDGCVVRIDPPLDQNWPEFEKLSWLAAVASTLTGLDVSVAASPSLRLPRVSEYEIAVGDLVFTSGPHSVGEASAFIDGIRAGHSAAIVERLRGGSDGD